MNYEEEYDRWLNRPLDESDEEVVLGECEHCFNPVLLEEAHFKAFNTLIHEDCLYDYLKEEYGLSYIPEFEGEIDG